MLARDWDAQTYDRISAPQQSWGVDVLQRLPLAGDELVLDAGCGTGRVTAMLLERLPRGRVLAVDGSPSMVEIARQRFQADERLAGRVEVLLQDLLQLHVPEPVDAILSTATFHWIHDHDLLYRRLHAALRPGGRLVAQCGGEGNVESVHRRAWQVGGRAPYEPHLRGLDHPWNFTSPAQAEQSLRGAGFGEARCWLTPAPTQPPEPLTFLRTVILNPFVERLPDELREPFVAEVAAGLGDPLTVDYVRLNIDAVA
jgi:trans-aconitate 2-methyltransferase